MSDDRLHGQCAIVTGAANGAGAASARLFARHGARVTLVDIDDAAGSALARELRELGHDAVFRHADVSEPAQVRGLFDSLDTIDILFNHAGTVIVRPFLEVDLAEWDRLLRVNVTSMFLMCQAALPGMLEAGHGTILNTSSISGFTASPFEAAYCTSKGAILQLTRSIAVEFRDRGIRCNAICPGFIRTAHGIREMAELTALGVDVSEPAIAAAQGRFCEPEDFAAAALSLVTDDLRFLNGASLVLDNGSTVLT